MADPALGALELDSIARGFHTADEVVKEAPVTLRAATPSTPGRFLIVFSGQVADVEYAFNRGCDIAGGNLVDRLFLPQVDEQVLPALAGVNPPPEPDAVGIVETRTAVSAILAADSAAKAARVRVVQVVVSRGLHGKGFLTLAGEVGDVQQGVEAGRRAAERRSAAISDVVIPNPDPELARRVYEGEWGVLEGRPLY